MMQDQIELEKNEFTQTMAQAVLDNHCVKKIQSLDTICKKWRFTIKYTKETEEKLITKSRVFIMTRSNNDVDFLHELVDWIAYYLANYVCRAPRYNDDLSVAKADLMKALFYEFPYIQKLQETKIKSIRANKQRRKKCKRRRRIAESLGENFVCRVTANGTAYVTHTTESSEKMFGSNPATVRKVFNEINRQH